MDNYSMTEFLSMTEQIRARKSCEITTGDCDTTLKFSTSMKLYAAWDAEGFMGATLSYGDGSSPYYIPTDEERDWRFEGFLRKLLGAENFSVEGANYSEY